MTSNLGRRTPGTSQRVWFAAIVVVAAAVIGGLGFRVSGTVGWAPTGPVLNEVVASNAHILADEDGDHSDWIELYNPTDDPVDLKGHVLVVGDSDGGWVFPSVVLEADGYVVVFASGKDRAEVGEELHTDFRVGRDGEELILLEPDGVTVADRLPAVSVPRDASYGRDPHDPARVCLFAFPTPGGRNVDECFDDEELGAPLFSVGSGFFEGPIDVEIQGISEGSTLYYTLDGSYPDPDTNPDATLVYDGPLNVTDRSDEPNVISVIDTGRLMNEDLFPHGELPPDGEVLKATVVRARTTYSRERVHTYFVGGHHRRDDLAVISLAADPEHLFDHEHGIYVTGALYDEYVASEEFDPNHHWRAPANFHQRGREWERPHANDLRRAIHFTYCEPPGDCVLSQDVGVRIHGNATRTRPQKSLRIYARNDYGDAYLRHPVFGDAGPDRHRRLILRNAGNAWSTTLLTDTYVQSLVSHLHVDTQAGRPAVVYLNGEYWGIHHVRERYDPHYFRVLHGVDPADVWMLGPNLSVDAGGSDVRGQFRSVLEQLERSDPSAPETLEMVGQALDLDNLIDYLIVQIFLSNADWPGSNTRLWRTASADTSVDAADGRWRWLIYDLDWMGGGAYEHDPEHRGLSRVHRVPESRGDRAGIPFIFSTLTQNDAFLHAFLGRFADHLNTTFHPSRTLVELDALESLLATEIERHIARWRYPESVVAWQEHVDEVRRFMRERPEIQWVHLQEVFGLDAPISVSVRSDHDRGYIRINDVDVLDGTPGVWDATAWSGRYFSGVPLSVEAVAHDGFRFAGWEVAPAKVGDRQRFEKIPHDDLELVPRFERDSGT